MGFRKKKYGVQILLAVAVWWLLAAGSPAQAQCIEPLDARHSIKFYASSGASARTGNSYDLYGIAWQYRWGGGL